MPARQDLFVHPNVPHLDGLIGTALMQPLAVHTHCQAEDMATMPAQGEVSLPPSTSHTLTVLSQLPEYSRLPSPATPEAQDWTGMSAQRCTISLQPIRSHTLMVLSVLPENSALAVPAQGQAPDTSDMPAQE